MYSLDIKVNILLVPGHCCSRSVGVKLTNHRTRTQVIFKDLFIVSDILLLCSQISSTQNRCKNIGRIENSSTCEKVFEILT